MGCKSPFCESPLFGCDICCDMCFPGFFYVFDSDLAENWLNDHDDAIPTSSQVVTEVGEFIEFSSSIVKTLRLPSGYVKTAIENGPVEIVDFPMNSMVICQFAM